MSYLLLEFLEYLNSFRRKRSNPEFVSIRRIIIVQKAGLGDFLMLLPTLLTIGNFKKEIEMDLIVPNEVFHLAKRYNIFHSVRLLENNSQFIFKRILSFLREIIINIFTSYDILFQPCSGTNWASYFLLVFTRAKLRIGFNYSGRFNFFDICIDYNNDIKDTIQNAVLLKYLSIKEKMITPKIPIKMEEYGIAKRIIKEKKQEILGIISGNEKIIGIYPTTLDINNGNSRDWGIENFASLIDILNVNQENILFIFLGSKNDKYYCEQIVKRTTTNPNNFIIAGINNLFESCAIAKYCNLIVGIDGGLMHFVNLMRIPSIVLWGPTTYKNHGYDNEYTFNLRINVRHNMLVNEVFIKCLEILKIVN